MKQRAAMWTNGGKSGDGRWIIPKSNDWRQNAASSLRFDGSHGTNIELDEKKNEKENGIRTQQSGIFLLLSAKANAFAASSTKTNIYITYWRWIRMRMNSPQVWYRHRPTAQIFANVIQNSIRFQWNSLLRIICWITFTGQIRKCEEERTKKLFWIDYINPTHATHTHKHIPFPYFMRIIYYPFFCLRRPLALLW